MSPWMLRIAAVLLWLSLLSGAELWGARPKTWVEVRSPHFMAISDAGASDAREILRQFEEIRVVFRSVFPKLRVDGGQPMVILALEDADSMKAFTPEGFQGSNAKRPAGVYFHRQDRDYALLRLDVYRSADQPFFALYHEYTHGIVRLNFASLPTWLNEGLADFYGATEIGASEIRIGKVPLARLNLLRQSGFLDLEELLQVDQRSPHYREGDKASIFYAESWALVHYLLMDPQAQTSGLFGRYLAALNRTGDSLAAGREAFSDLRRFLPSLVSYAKQPRFHYRSVGLTAKVQDKDLLTRMLSPAEALIVRAEFLQRTGHEKEARPLLEEALKLEPTRAELHAALGYGYYLQRENDQAEQAFMQSMHLNGRDFRVPYYCAEILLRKGGFSSENTPRITALLESARALNPDFAAVHGFLSVAYRKNPETRAKSLEEARRAIDLEPSILAYRVDLGDAILAMRMGKEAELLGNQIRQMAKTAQEKALAEAFAARLEAFKKEELKVLEASTPR